MTKVKEASQLQPAIAKAFAEGDEVMLESFISGTEVTCGCYKVGGGLGIARKEVIFPLTEVVTKNEFLISMRSTTESLMRLLRPVSLPN